MNEHDRLYGRIETYLGMGYPLTVRELGRLCDATGEAVTAVLSRLEKTGHATHYLPPNTVSDLWIATQFTDRMPTAVLVAAKIGHQRTTGHQEVFLGANFVECMTCGKHAHVVPSYEKPLLVHGRTGSLYHPTRPEDF